MFEILTQRKQGDQLMNLQGKKLIFLGGSGLDACAVKRAKELGVTTIVANKYDSDRSPTNNL